MSEDELRALVDALPDAGGVPRLPRGYVVKARPDAGRAATLGTDLPTLDGTVMPGYDLLAWTGMFGPAGVPKDIVDKIAGPIEKALANNEVRERFRDVGVEVSWIGPAGFPGYVQDELVKWTTLIKAAGIEPE